MSTTDVNLRTNAPVFESAAFSRMIKLADWSALRTGDSIPLSPKLAANESLAPIQEDVIRVINGLCIRLEGQIDYLTDTLLEKPMVCGHALNYSNGFWTLALIDRLLAASGYNSVETSGSGSIEMEITKNNRSHWLGDPVLDVSDRHQQLTSSMKGWTTQIGNWLLDRGPTRVQDERQTIQDGVWESCLKQIHKASKDNGPLVSVLVASLGLSFLSETDGKHDTKDWK